MDTKKEKDKDFEVYFKKDGNAWTATFKDVADPRKNPAGYGGTPEEAFRDLFNEKSKSDYQNEVRRD